MPLATDYMMLGIMFYSRAEEQKSRVARETTQNYNNEVQRKPIEKETTGCNVTNWLYTSMLGVLQSPSRGHLTEADISVTSFKSLQHLYYNRSEDYKTHLIVIRLDLGY